MYSDKTQKVHVALTKQANVLKTKDNNHVMFDGSEEVQSISKLEFKEVSIPLERVLAELRNGRCIGQFYCTDPYFRKKGSHPLHDWRGTSWIGVDIDDSDVDPKTMHNELRWTPTITMTTQSHMKPGRKNRYRLFFFFRPDIENYEGLKRVADRIAGEVRRVLQKYGDDPKKVFDDKTKDKSRFYYGNPYECQVETSWAVYAPSEIYEDYTDTCSARSSRSEKSGKESGRRTEKALNPKKWKELQNYCHETKSFWSIIKRFGSFYPLRFETEVEHKDDGCPFTLPPENYMYLQFRWEKNASGNGSRIKKWHDGERRRAMLPTQLKLLAYLNGCKLKIDEFVFNAIYLFYLAYANSHLDGKKCFGDDFIQPWWVMEKAREIYHLSKREIDSFVRNEMKKDGPQCAFLVNRIEAEKRGMTLKQLLGKARSQYAKYQWKKRIEVLVPFINNGYTNPQLAVKLKELRGEEFTPETIGSHVAEYRDYRVNHDAKNGNGHGDSPEINSEMPENEDFNRKNRAVFDFSCDNSDFSSAPVIPMTARACSALSTPRSIIMGGISSTTHQIAVANDARMKDADRRRKRFGKLYLQHRSLSDKDRKEIIKKEMGISDRTYYYNKKGCEEELDILSTWLSERTTKE